MKQRYTSLIAGAALVLSIALLPSASFAMSRGGQSASNEGTYHVPAMPVPQQRGGNFFGGIASWFNGNRGASTVHAQDNNGTNTNPVQSVVPSISGITAPTVLNANATGTWTVNASDPQNGSLTYSVDWGDQGMLRSLLAMAQPFTQTSTFTHSYANPGTYTVKFTVKDDAGRTASSSATVHVVAAAPAIAIANVNAKATNQTHAYVTWTTNVHSDATVFYGTTNPVDTSTASSATEGNDRPLNHRVNLSGLTAGTTYYFVVESKDASGNVATSTQGSFTTPAGTTNGAPTISSFTGPQTLATDTEGTWTANASDPQNGALTYAITWGDESLFGRMMALVAPQQVFTQTSTFTHTYANAGTYTVTLTAKDAAGKTATATATVVVTAANGGGTGTTTPPAISGITALVGENSITFNWNTDVASDSEVYYSASSPVTIGNAATTPTTDASQVTAHSLNVGNLTAGTTYYFLVQSVGADGGTTVTHEFSLTTMSS